MLRYLFTDRSVLKKDNIAPNKTNPTKSSINSCWFCNWVKPSTLLLAYSIKPKSRVEADTPARAPYPKERVRKGFLIKPFVAPTSCMLRIRKRCEYKAKRMV